MKLGKYQNLGNKGIIFEHELREKIDLKDLNLYIPIVKILQIIKNNQKLHEYKNL